MAKKLLTECIITSTTIGDDVIMAKNRDRTYRPNLQIVRECVNGVEIVYLRDLDTNWSEGMNNQGLGIINSTLNGGFDENERIIVRKKGKKTKDGKVIRLALTKKSIDIATKVMIKNNTCGHTFLCDTKDLYTLEIAPGFKAKVKKSSTSNINVRTNHGVLLPGTGYTQGEHYKSTQIRKASAEKVLPKAKDYNEVAKLLRTDMYEPSSMLNMSRKTDYIYTTSQMVMNLTKKIFILYLYEEYTDQFLGIMNKCPDDYKPEIDIYVYKIKPVMKKVDSEVSE